MDDTPTEVGFDPTQITLDELEVLEMHGVDFVMLATVSETGQMPDGSGYSKMMRGIGYIVNHRIDPSYTWEDTGNMTLGDVTELLAEVGDVTNPKAPAVV